MVPIASYIASPDLVNVPPPVKRLLFPSQPMPALLATSQPAKPVFNALSNQPYGASPYPAAPSQPTSSILPAPQFSNIIPTAQEDSEPIKAWKAKQAEEIKERDDRDRSKRDEMKNKAEKSIDQFYEDYNKQKERNIRENK